MLISIKVTINVHAFGEDMLQDEVLDSFPARYGVNPPLSIDPLCNKRDQTVQITVDEKTSIESFISLLNKSIWGDNWDKLAIGIVFFNLLDGSRARIDNPNANFLFLLEKYLDSSKTNHITVSYYVCLDAGDVMSYENLRFYMPSKEKGHNKPHVHVEDRNSGNTCSICILDGEKLAGDKFKTKDLRKAQKIIMDRRDFFIDCWNKLTDGLMVDINHELGLIKY